MTRAPYLADLREPPVVGRFYLVPVVPAEQWCGITGNLPVIGPSHTDVEHFNFRHRHYHVDARFLSASERAKISRYSSMYREGQDVDAAVGAWPLTNTAGGGVPRGLPKLARRRCTANAFAYRHGHQAAVQALRRDLGEPDAILLKDGRKLCPHRKVDLSQFAPDADGFVTCPLHGLRVRCALAAAATEVAA